jgi:hypothetical protein
MDNDDDHKVHRESFSRIKEQVDSLCKEAEVSVDFDEYNSFVLLPTPFEAKRVTLDERQDVQWFRSSSPGTELQTHSEWSSLTMVEAEASFQRL